MQCSIHLTPIGLLFIPATKLSSREQAPCNAPSTALECYGVSASIIFPAAPRLTDYCGERNVIDSHASPKTDEEPALVSRLSQPSSNTPDEHILPLHHAQSASSSPVTRPSTPLGDVSNNNLARASRISQSPDATEEQGQSCFQSICTGWQQRPSNCTTTQV